MKAMAYGLCLLLISGTVFFLPNQVRANNNKVNEEKALMKILDKRQGRTVAQMQNGLIVIVQELKTAPVVSTQAWVKAGSIYEGKFMGYGISHYLEHLASGGSTKTRSESENNALLASIGGQTNASTSLDFVRYYINCLESDVNVAIDMLSDYMQNCDMNEREVEREREVIRREFEMGRGEPSRVMWKLTQLARYADHPARHPIIGYQSFFEKVTRQDLLDFYKQYYVPNNMAFVVVGDVDTSAVLKQIEANWQDAERKVIPELYQADLANQATIATAYSEAYMDISAPRVRVAWAGTTLAGDGDYALDLLADILGDGESSRLVRKIRDEKRLVNSISAFNYSTQWGRGIFAVDFEVALSDDESKAKSVDTQKDAIRTAREAIMAEIKRIADQGVDPEELASAKRRVLAHELMSSQSVERVAEKITSGLMGMGDPDYMKRWVKGVEMVTSDQIKAACQSYLLDQKATDVVLLPVQEDGEPTRIAQPAKAPGDERPMQLEDGLQAVVIDNDEQLSKYNILLEKRKDEHGCEDDKALLGPVKAWTLENGLRVRFQNSQVVPAVSMQLYRLGGLLDDNLNQLGLANAMAIMQMRGTKTKDQQTIAKTVESLGAGLNTGSGDNSWYTQAECLTEDFDQVFELFADVTLNANFPEQEWERLQPRLLAAIDRQTDQWYGELSKGFRQDFFGAHPWSVSSLGKRDVVESLTAEALRSHFNKRMMSSEAVLVIVGDVAEEKVRKLVEEHFGNMQANEGAAFNLSQPKTPTPSVNQYVTQKPLAAVQMAFGPGITRDSEDYPVVEVLTRILSNFPSGRLDVALRGEGEGLVYAVWAGQKTGLARGYIAGAFNCGPDKLVTALNAAADVFVKVKAGELTQEEIEKAKLAVLTDTYFDKQSNSSRAAELGLDVLYEVKIKDKAFEKAVRDVDLETLQAAAKKYLAIPVVNIITAKKADEADLQQVLTKLKS